MMELRFFIRKPIFPVLGSVDGYFIGAKSVKSLVNQLSKNKLTPDQFYNFVDKNGEGWSLYITGMVFSPLTHKKRWTKKEIIRLFNDRKNTECGNGQMYSEKSLSAKKLDRIISELAELASK